MNIAFVNATFGWGGVKTWYLQFAERLAKRGNRISIYGRQPEFIDAAQERVGHGEQVHFGPDLNPLTIRFFYEEFQRHGIEIVVTNIGKDLATAGVAARLLNIPVVQRIGLPEDIPYRLKTRLLHAWIRPAFLCPCRFIAEGFIESLPYVKAKDVHVVLNGKKASNTSLELHHPRRLICTQQLEADKGHAMLLRALSRIPEPFELHIWGRGREENALRQLAQELGLSDRVVWHGFSMNIMDDLQAGDIFLLASYCEGLPNTLLEGMAAGLLPITRDVGGVEEVVPETLRRWMLPYDSKEDVFAKTMCAAINLPDTELLKQRECAREACRKSFDIDGQAEELESYFLRIALGGKGCTRF